MSSNPLLLYISFNRERREIVFVSSIIVKAYAEMASFSEDIGPRFLIGRILLYFYIRTLSVFFSLLSNNFLAGYSTLEVVLNLA